MKEKQCTRRDKRHRQIMVSKVLTGEKGSDWIQAKRREGGLGEKDTEEGRRETDGKEFQRQHREEGGWHRRK